MSHTCCVVSEPCPPPQTAPVSPQGATCQLRSPCRRRRATPHRRSPQPPLPQPAPPHPRSPCAACPLPLRARGSARAAGARKPPRTTAGRCRRDRGRRPGRCEARRSCQGGWARWAGAGPTAGRGRNGASCGKCSTVIPRLIGLHKGRGAAARTSWRPLRETLRARAARDSAGAPPGADPRRRSSVMSSFSTRKRAGFCSTSCLRVLSSWERRCRSATMSASASASAFSASFPETRLSPTAGRRGRRAGPGRLRDPCTGNKRRPARAWKSGGVWKSQEEHVVDNQQVGTSTGAKRRLVDAQNQNRCACGRWRPRVRGQLCGSWTRSEWHYS